MSAILRIPEKYKTICGSVTQENFPPPYHVFKVLEQYFVFDTTACRFYRIDEVTYQLLLLSSSVSLDIAVEQLSKENLFPVDEIYNAAAEIALLAEHGLFEQTNYSLQDDCLDKILDRYFSVGTSEFLLGLTDTCNLACSYCYCNTSRDADMPFEGFMTEEIACRAIKWLFQINTENEVRICFFGGEPFLNKTVLRSAIEYSEQLAKEYDKAVRFSTTSNVTLVDEEFATYLTEHKVKVLVSFDGPQHIHDGQCLTKDGRGSYAMASRGAKHIIQHQEHTTARATMVHPVPNIKELIVFFKEFGFSDCFLGPASNPIFHPTPSDFTDEDYRDFATQNEELIPSMLEDIAAGKALFYDPYRFDRGIDNLVPSIFPVKCGAAKGCLYISPRGDLYPCHHFCGMKNWRLGNINDLPSLNIYKDFWKKYRKAIKNCEKCWAAAICQGPCPADIMMKDGDFYQNGSHCDSQKDTIEHRVYFWAWKSDSQA
ncbi:radical SAM protein [Victivallis sp. Marseille-Q1083]|uniref:radical SAM/SPASM domain-containing protein n=1 Tax=Victivallis sp. Marseille-Q1083 TaxID=2717288 RepID=UPI00158A0BBF|nr:radical SAM protein [Victivallis sp. Marseille-Q1083]